MIPEHKLKELQRIGAINFFNDERSSGGTVFIHIDGYLTALKMSVQGDIDLLTAHFERFAIQKAKERWGENVDVLTSWTGRAGDEDNYGVEIDPFDYDDFIGATRTSKLEAIAQACIAVGGK